MSKHIRLPGYDATDLDRLSYSNGDLVNDTTNITVRLMDGVTPGGFKLATQEYVQNNTITSGNLASNLAVALTPYAKTVDLAPYALTVDVNSAISAIPIYSLPIAGTSSGALGGVKVDGTSITINPTTGVISGSNQYTLPIATTSVIGGVRPDGTTITINPTTGVISGANTYVLPTATSSVKGGVIVPAVATSGINNSSGTISLATATTTQLGGVKVDGSTITINGSGVISGAQLYTLPAATTTVLGGVTIPAVANSGLTNTSGAIRLATATTNQLGGVKVDGVTITINGSGVIAANITGAIVFQGGWSAATNTPTLSNVSSAYNTNGFEFVTTAAGTVNFGAGNVTFAVGDNVIYDGVKWVKIPIGSSAGTVNSLLTVNNSGTGDVSGTQFNGSAPITISYNSIGASPTAGSASLTTVGTIDTGTWNGNIIGAAYGGTGVNNSYTLAISGANRTLDQDVTSGASPTFNGTNFSGTASGLSVGNATAAATATKATNIAGGVANQILYQTSADTTSYVTAASGTNTFLSWTGSAFTWTTVASATTATNIAGGALRQILVQTGAGATGFVAAPTTNATYLQYTTAGGLAWASVSGATGGTVTSITASASGVNGLSLSGGTITGSGTIAIQGTLSLATAPAIGSTGPNTGAFTTLSASTSVSFSPSGTITLNPTTAGTINNMSIGATTASTGRFTTVTSTIATGTAPFTVASTTNVANLNASSLGGATFSSPGAIGGGTASSGTFTTLTASTQAGTTNGSGTLYLNNTTQSRIDYAAGGANFGAPTFNAVSVGAKIILWPSNAVASADYAIGIEGSTMWLGVPTTSEQFKFYGGTTNIATLTGAGAFTPKELRDTVYTSGGTTGTIAPNCANGNVQTITLTGSITLNAFTSPVSGQSLTLIITQPASGGPFTLTSTMKFAGGFKTLSTAANAIDMLTISYIGTTYYASLVTGFA